MATPVMNRDEGGIQTEPLMGRPACQDNWRAEEELAVPELLMKAANGSQNVEQEFCRLKKIVIQKY